MEILRNGAAFVRLRWLHLRPDVPQQLDLVTAVARTGGDRLDRVAQLFHRFLADLRIAQRLVQVLHLRAAVRGEVWVQARCWCRGRGKFELKGPLAGVPFVQRRLKAIRTQPVGDRDDRAPELPADLLEFRSASPRAAVRARHCPG